MTSRGLLHRTTLFRNLNSLIEGIPKTDLPVTIKAIYTFGGILRDKDRLHDFDLVCLYTMAPEQKQRWEKFRHNFSTYGNGDAIRYPLRELEPFLKPFREKSSLREATKDKNLVEVLKQKGIPPDWAGCFSWTEITRGPHGDGIFYPQLERVIIRLLIGDKIRGLQLQIVPYEEFINGHTLLVARNYVLAWSPKKPNVIENIERRDEQAKTDFLQKELLHFINDELPRIINKGDMFTASYNATKDAVIEIRQKADIKINVEALHNQHTEIKLTGKESYIELITKCEIARVEMRKYRQEAIVLDVLKNAIEKWIELRNEEYFRKYNAEEFVAKYVLENTGKNLVKEKQIRHILKILSLPEDQVVTIKAQGNTYYRLPEGETSREKLLKRSEIEEKKRKLRMKIMKVVRPVLKDADVSIELKENLEPATISIEVNKYPKEGERDKIVADLVKKGFEVDNHLWGIYGIKQTELTGKEGIKQLEEIAKRMLMVNPQYG